MKFTVNCTDLKKAADKVMSVIPKKASMHFIECIEITADNNSIILHTTNAEQFAEVRVDATVVEPGVTYIHKDNMKKVYSLSELVTIEVADGQFNVKGSKKKSAVPVKEYGKDDVIAFPTMENAEVFMNIDSQRLVQTLGSLSCFLGDDSNKLTTGYSFDGLAKRIVALDGFRMGLRSMLDDFILDKKVVVPGIIYTQLKKIANEKNDIIKVLVNNNHIEFSGKDFKLYSSLYEGEYFRVDLLINTNFDYEMVLNPKELYKLGKEYNGVVKNLKEPMYLIYNKELNIVRTGVAVQDYITVDELEVDKNYGLKKDFIYAFNPRYIYEAMQLYNDTVKCHGVIKTGQNSCMITPIIFDNNEYLSLILPVRIENSTKFDRFIEYLKTV